MGLFEKLFNRKKVDITDLLAKGATVIDVRSNKEFESGNVANSINIPLAEIKNNIEMLRAKQPLVLCCASGMRSSMAVKELKENGFEQLVNGGGWQDVKSQMTHS
ncbi:MAG TPA: rhodanese-like domain-containing protein [Bacteroidia bacterium]